MSAPFNPSYRDGYPISISRLRPVVNLVKVKARVVFEGRVQGVFFRANTKKCAESLGLVGWVRNTRDGRVEAVFEGEEEDVRKAIDWCEHEQPYAEVTSKTVELSEPDGRHSDFAIRS